MTREEADAFQKALDEYEGSAARVGCACIIEPMLPVVKLEGGMDLTGFVGAFASVLGVKIEASRGTIPVVDGHEDFDPDDLGWEEYERLYCVRVPGEVMKEALDLRAAKVMFEAAIAGSND